MFIDKAVISVRAGSGGNGAVADRYRLPGVAGAEPAPKPAEPASAGPKMAAKVRLQLHRKPEQEPPTAERKPRQA